MFFERTEAGPIPQVYCKTIVEVLTPRQIFVPRLLLQVYEKYTIFARYLEILGREIA